MGPSRFYRDLWSRRSEPDRGRQRDWLHRVILDRIFDPYSNPRGVVALKLLIGGHRVLDVGCWSGSFLAQVARTNLYTGLFGVDLVPEAVSAATGSGIRGSVVNLNTAPLPFSEASFDAVTMLAVLERIFDPHMAVTEVRRVLKLGGQFIVAVPNVASASNRLRILGGRVPVTSTGCGWDGGHLHYFTPYDLRKLLHSSGFVVVEQRGTGGLASIRGKWLSLLCGEFVVSALKMPV
jgi:methionine biosynthesis protein MetW